MGDIAADLVDIQKAGLVLIPAVAGAFTAANGKLNLVIVDSFFAHDSGLGMGGAGPRGEFESLKTALSSCCQKSGEVMQNVADNLVQTTKDFARTDEDLKQKFVNLGGVL